MMIKNILYTAALLMVASTASAQNDSLFSENNQKTQLMNQGRYDYELSKSEWQGSENAASLSLQDHAKFGKAYFNYNHRSGDLFRVQEGNVNNGLLFFTESYQKLGKYLYAYGKFDFNMGRTKGRSWADVMRPYNSNPYFSGSDIKGSYDEQNINLTAAVGTTELTKGLRLGAKLDYNLGDLSRLRDPRSRAQLLDYKIAPAITYTFGSNTLGLAGHYNRRKEKIGNITTVESATTKLYYLMYGLENAVGSKGGSSSFQREWVNHNFGAELSYGYKNHAENQYSSMTAVSIERGSEGVYGQYKYEPGHYYTYNYGLKSQHRLVQEDAAIHQLDLSANFQEGYADEYRQQLVVTTDSATGYNSYRYDNQLTYNKRYQVKTFDASLHYRCNVLNDDEEDVLGFFGLLANYQQASNKYLLNTSKLEYGRFDVAVELGANLPLGISSDINFGYSWSTKSKLDLADATTDYAQSVLVPDMNILGANYLHCHLSLLYTHPITIKGSTSNWFVKGYADIASTMKEPEQELSRINAGISIGIFY